MSGLIKAQVPRAHGPRGCPDGRDCKLLTITETRRPALHQKQHHASPQHIVDSISAIRSVDDTFFQCGSNVLEWPRRKRHIVCYPYAPPVHAWTLRALFPSLSRCYDSIVVRAMLSTMMLPLVDLTLQVELTPVWSHSPTTKPRILKRHLLCVDYITHQVWVGKVDSIPQNPKFKSVLRTFGEVCSIRKCVFLLEDAGLARWARAQAREAS